jgi:hypothetical protein
MRRAALPQEVIARTIGRSVKTVAHHTAGDEPTHVREWLKTERGFFLQQYAAADRGRTIGRGRQMLKAFRRQREVPA